MSENIFEQSFESLLQSVGIESEASQETVTQEPVTTAPATEPTPSEDIFDQFQLPPTTQAEPESPSEAYKVDMDIFGAQDVKPDITPTEVKQETVESAKPVVETQPEPEVQPEVEVVEQTVTPEPEVKPAKKTRAKRKTKAQETPQVSTNQVSTNDGLIDEDIAKQIEAEVDVIVRGAIRKSLVKNLRDIASQFE